MVTRPVLKYNGGKWILGPWIRSFFPDHDTFVEGFGGGGSITIQKERATREFYFDIDSEVANFMWVISHRDSAKELIRRIYWTPYAREIHAWAVSETISTDPIDRALKFYCKCWMDRNYVRGKSFRLYGNMDSSGGHLPASLWANVRNLYQIAKRLRGVTVECKPYIQIASSLDSLTTLHYLDPPYLGSVRGSGELYIHEMKSALAHARLLKFILKLKGMIIISGYPSGLYARMLETQGWKMVTKATRDNQRRERIEALWLNPLVQQRLAEREPELFEARV
ncbi:D12 class N6 adenine-specific DNA methyltransferase [Leptospira santarosai str. CBC379]|uniref:DNA adenine methylase n=1 Tax=Leptospira santarosai TaxID=28183 RepID=UPI000297EC5B|nr:DNA adenine methylase [Leptospira santarosai]EKR89746.1 D12 class N6 adenine-specific DNA methyltransferase [Leptospira santarosai str. CBC379]